MTPSKPKKGKRMEKTVSFFTNDEMFETLENAKFYLKKSKGEILREAVEEYLKKHFPDDVQKKIKELLK